MDSLLVHVLTLQLTVASLTLETVTPKVEAAVVLPLPEGHFLQPMAHNSKEDVALVDLQALATKIAKEHGLKVNRFLNVIACESKWNPDAVGDNFNSYGLLQINLPSHPEISKAKALDPYFSIEWAAQRWEEGDAWMWSCYKNLGYLK